MFDALPPPARDPFLKMYKRMESGFAPKLQRASGLEKDYGPLDQVFNQETRQFMAQRMGVSSPHQIIQRWAGAEKALLDGQSRDVMVAHLIRAYGCNPATVARHLNELHRGGGQGGGASPGNGAQPDGQTSHLDNRIRAIEGHIAGTVQQQQAAVADAAQRQVSNFAAATGSDGMLLHPHFAQVEHTMTMFAADDLRAGKTPDLEDLYQRAAWAHPEIRGEMQEADYNRRAREAVGARRARSDAARRAGSSISGSPTGSGWSQEQVNGYDRSIRDTISAALGSDR